MAELRVQGASVQCFCAFPGVLVVLWISIPVAAKVYAIDLPKPTLFYQLFYDRNRGIKPVLLDDEQAPVCFLCLFIHFTTIVGANGHWLFANNVLTCTEGGNGMLCMQPIWRANGNYFNLRFIQQQLFYRSISMGIIKFS